jgi:hypothetical protein
MKKLLALILCVMMFVAVIPTSAFAASKVVGSGSTVASFTTVPDKVDKFDSVYNAKKAVEAASDAIQAMYGGVAADQGVFATVKAIDSVVVDLSKQIFDGVDKLDVLGTTYTNKTLTDNTKAYLRTHIGGEIIDYMKDHIGTYAELKEIKDANGNVIGKYTVYDPVKYMNAFATAASKAMSGEKGAKNIEAIVYSMAAAKVQKDSLDAMKDLYDEIHAWEGTDNIFGAYGFNAVVKPDATTDWAPLALLDADNVTVNSEYYSILNDWANATNGTAPTTVSTQPASAWTD